MYVWLDDWHLLYRRRIIRLVELFAILHQVRASKSIDMGARDRYESQYEERHNTDELSCFIFESRDEKAMYVHV